jgi:hypothetical protein
VEPISKTSKRLVFIAYRKESEAKFLVTDWGDIVDCCIRLSYQPASLCDLGGPVRQPYAIVDYIPQSETKNLASEQSDCTGFLATVGSRETVSSTGI